jgi:sugar lactone lactonase YvrE
MVIDEHGRAYVGSQARSHGVIVRIDADGSVWTALTLANQFQRIVDGGAVTDRIDAGERTAIACTLGGAERRTLFLVTTTDAYPQRLVGTKLSRVEALMVDVPAPGDHEHHF